MRRKQKDNERKLLAGVWIASPEMKDKWNNLHKKVLALLEAEFDEPVHGLLFLKWEVELFEKHLHLEGTVLEKQKTIATMQ